MKHQDRQPEVYYYEWSVNRWRASETRALLNSAGRGIYREILDLCYVQGSIPKDIATLAKQCDCEPSEIEAIWAIISRHFYQDKHDKNRLRNKFSEVKRKTFFAHMKTQKQNASNGGAAKSRKSNKISSSGSAQENTTQHNTTQHNTTEGKIESPQAAQSSPPLIQLSGEWPETAKVIRSHFPQTDFKFVLNLAERSTQEFLGVPSPKIKLTDQTLAAAVQHCWHDRQYSAPLFLTTVPNCIRSWAENGIQPRDGPRNEAPEETTAERKAREEKQRLELVRRGILQPRAGEAAAGR